MDNVLYIGWSTEELPTAVELQITPHTSVRYVVEANMLAILANALPYLDHPDVQAMHFALPAYSAAHQIRTVLAEAGETERARQDSTAQIAV